jgi:hypothetical protein
MGEEWLSYAQLAERLGCTAAAARRRAQRMRWPRTKGNDGRARVLVPEGELPQPREDRTGAAQPDQSAAVARLEGELAGLREALAEARARADGESARAAGAESRASELAKAVEDMARALEAARSSAENSAVAPRRPFWRWWRR